MAHSYTHKTLKLLFGRADRCAFPGCTQELIFEDRGRLSVVAQIAHIRSESPIGPRHVVGYTPVDSEENLLLLCGVHHKPVDDHQSIYTIDELLVWKQDQVTGSRRRDLADEQSAYIAQQLEALAAKVPFDSRVRSRSEGLELAAREGRARRIARLALFVHEERQDAVLEWMAKLDTPVVEVPAGSVRVLVGQLGAGKSEQAFRWWEQGLEAATSEDQIEIPLYFTARKVLNALQESIVAQLGRDPARTCRVVLDELDGVSPPEAAGILHDARQLVQVWPQLSVLACSRSSSALAPNEQVDLLPWPRQRGAELVELALGEPLPHRLWTRETAELLTSPLTSLALAARVQAGGDTKVSRSQLLAHLAVQVVESHGGEPSEDTWHDLARFAVSVLGDAPGTHQNDFLRLPRLRRMIATGLVSRNHGELTFALPVFEQYFGAEAITLGHADLETAAGPLSFPRWRYALVFAVSTSTPSRQEELMINLARINPAAAFWVLDEVTEHLRSEPLQFPPDEAVAAFLKHRGSRPLAPGESLARWAGRWLRDAEKALFEGLGPLAETLLPHQNGTLAHWGVRLDGGRITIATARSSNSISEIEELTDSRPGPSEKWQSWADMPFPTTDLGRWTLAQQYLQDALGTAIKKRTLAVPATSWLTRERLYRLALLVHRFGGQGRGRAINVTALRKKIATWIEETSSHQGAGWQSSGQVVDLKDVRWLATHLATIDTDVLLAPWPEPDLPPGARHYYLAFSPELTLTIATNVLREALVGYKDLVECNFAAFGHALGLYGSFPVRAEALITRFDRDDFSNLAIWLRLGTHSAPQDHESPTVDVQLVTDPDSSIFQSFNHVRDSGAKNVFNNIGREIFSFDIGDDCAATDLAYGWLARDLANVGWLNRYTR